MDQPRLFRPSNSRCLSTPLFAEQCSCASHEFVTNFSPQSGLVLALNYHIWHSAVRDGICRTRSLISSYLSRQLSLPSLCPKVISSHGVPVISCQANIASYLCSPGKSILKIHSPNSLHWIFHCLNRIYYTV